jgi:hypothetical protein
VLHIPFAAMGLLFENDHSPSAKYTGRSLSSLNVVGVNITLQNADCIGLLLLVFAVRHYQFGIVIETTNMSALQALKNNPEGIE